MKKNWNLDYLREVLGARYFLYPQFLKPGGLQSDFKNSLEKESSLFRFSDFDISKRGSFNGKWLFITEKHLKREDFLVLDRLTRALKAERDFLHILIDRGDLKTFDFRFLKSFLSFSNFRFGIFFGKVFFNFLEHSFLKEKKIDSYKPFLLFDLPFVVVYSLNELHLEGNEKGEVKKRDLLLKKKRVWTQVQDLLLDSNS